MTIIELRNSEEYAKCMRKIEGYSKGFEFTVPYWKMTKEQANAMKIILQDAVRKGLIESIRIGLSLELVETDETFRRV